MAPIFIITGPPAAGKTSLCQALARRLTHAYHLEVDELRLGVVAGLAESVPWTEETERQFQVAELASCDIASRYQDAGFTVLVDHCRNLSRWNELIATELAGREVRPVLLLPALELNLRRNLARTNKPFDPAILEDTIRFTNQAFHAAPHDGWTLLDPAGGTPDELATRLVP